MCRRCTLYTSNRPRSFSNIPMDVLPQLYANVSSKSVILPVAYTLKSLSLKMPHSNAEPQLLFKCDMYLQIIPPGPRQISLHLAEQRGTKTIKCQIQECQIHLPREILSWHISRQQTVLICTKITLMHTLGLWWYAIALAPAFPFVVLEVNEQWIHSTLQLWKWKMYVMIIL